MAEAGRVFQRRIEKQRKDDRCRLEDASGNRNEREDRRTISVLAWTVAGRSSDSDGGPWPLYRMYKRHRQWTLLLHASVGRLHSESTSGPGCPRCEWTMALATFSCAFSSDFRDLADAPHLSWLQIFQLCLSFWTSSFDLVLFLKIPSGKRKISEKTTQNALAPSIFIVLSIALKLGTPLLHTQAQNRLLQNF